MPERKAAAETTVRLDYLAKIMDEMKGDLKALPDRMATQYATKEELSQVKQDYQTIRNDIKDLSTKIDSRDSLYVTKEEFAPVKKLVYGLVALILTSVIV